MKRTYFASIVLICLCVICIVYLRKTAKETDAKLAYESKVTLEFDWFSDYNGEKIQRIISEQGDDYSPATCDDIIFYKANQGDTLDIILVEMKKAILEPLTIESSERSYTVTSYSVEEQDEIYCLAPTLDLPKEIEEAEWIREYEWAGVADEVWLIPYLDGYYSFEGVDMISMDVALEMEPFLEKDGMIPFLSQGSEGTFYFILMRQDNIYCLQRAVNMEKLLHK